ncbi:IS66 family transposase [Methylorubrum sp. GM97]|uniref:IS66 family transposase n=1 Tax=Methylorubrum sp. GM97 TaxID=2938232 RepID=UPI0021C2C65A|nr:IS66 family transposase [Methylorubrum sp. GM97]
MCARPSPSAPTSRWCRRPRHHTVPRRRAGPGLLAYIAVAKFDDHLPLYREAEIYARDGPQGGGCA